MVQKGGGENCDFFWDLSIPFSLSLSFISILCCAIQARVRRRRKGEDFLTPSISPSTFFFLLFIPFSKGRREGVEEDPCWCWIWNGIRQISPFFPLPSPFFLDSTSDLVERNCCIALATEGEFLIFFLTLCEEMLLDCIFFALHTLKKERAKLPGANCFQKKSHGLPF